MKVGLVAHVWHEMAKYWRFAAQVASRCGASPAHWWRIIAMI
jgi:hypothetical protein